MDDIAPELEPETGKRRPGPKKQGYDDMVRLAGTLERLPVERKVQAGEWLLERLRNRQRNRGRPGGPSDASARGFLPMAAPLPSCRRRLPVSGWKRR
jgi:hypothetical protein